MQRMPCPAIPHGFRHIEVIDCCKTRTSNRIREEYAELVFTQSCFLQTLNSQMRRVVEPSGKLRPLPPITSSASFTLGTLHLLSTTLTLIIVSPT